MGKKYTLQQKATSSGDGRNSRKSRENMSLMSEQCELEAGMLKLHCSGRSSVRKHQARQRHKDERETWRLQGDEA